MKELKLRVWDNAMIYDNFCCLHADPKYVMRFTELYDKNGQEIWEGDIIEHEEGYIFFIAYNAPAFSMFCAEDLLCLSGIFYELCGDEVFVVGNIYENPELLRRSNA